MCSKCKACWRVAFFPLLIRQNCFEMWCHTTFKCFTGSIIAQCIECYHQNIMCSDNLTHVHTVPSSGFRVHRYSSHENMYHSVNLRKHSFLLCSAVFVPKQRQHQFLHTGCAGNRSSPLRTILSPA